MSNLLEEHIKGTIFLKRLFIVLIVQAICIFILLFRLFYLQILHFNDFKQKSENNRIKINVIPPLRGNILDRNNNKLTNNRNSYELILYKNKKQKESEVLKQVTDILNLDKEKQIRAKKQLKNNRNRPIVSILNNLNWEELAKIETNSYKLNNVVIEEGYIREYPYSKQFAHLLGYVAMPNDKDINKLSGKIKKDILMHPNYKIGKNGLEASFNSKLTGESGYKKIEVNAYNVPVKEIEKKDAKIGQNVKLTIDLKLQDYIYKLIENRRAAAVVLNVNTGEILAMVSTPSFETNEFIDGISNDYWSELINDERKPLYNKTISALYSMGSTFKPIVAMAALENGWDENKTFECQGYMLLSKKTVFNCWKRSGHGKLNLVEAIERSCNIFFADLGMYTGINNIYNMAKQLGIGEKFDINLNEYNKGILPNPTWKKENYGEIWTKGDTVNMSIGQGYVLANPLQMAVMVSRIANGGYPIKPFLIYNSYIRDYNENLYLSLPLFKEKSVRITKEGMFQVINGKNGTAYKLKDRKYEIAGKTGTAQVVSAKTLEKIKESLDDTNTIEEKYRNHSIFVGFSPMEKTKYGIAIVVEHGGGGSAVAAPLGVDILKFAIDNNI